MYCWNYFRCFFNKWTLLAEITRHLNENLYPVISFHSTWKQVSTCLQKAAQFFTPVFSLLYSVIFQPTCLTERLELPVEINSREKKKHSFSALSITLIAAADMKAVLAYTLFLFHTCAQNIHNGSFSYYWVCTKRPERWLVAEERIENGP